MILKILWADDDDDDDDGGDGDDDDDDVCGRQVYIEVFCSRWTVIFMKYF